MPPAEGVPAAAGPAAEPVPVADPASQPTPVIDFPRREAASVPLVTQVPAGPSARRLARELGVDINEVTGHGPGGRISRNDVKEHAKRIVQTAAHATPGVSAPVELLSLIHI